MRCCQPWGPARHRVSRKAPPRCTLPEAKAEPTRPHGGSFCAPRNHCLPQIQEARGRGQALLSGLAGSCPPAPTAGAPTEQHLQGIRVTFLHTAQLSTRGTGLATYKLLVFYPSETWFPHRKMIVKDGTRFLQGGCIEGFFLRPVKHGRGKLSFNFFSFSFRPRNRKKGSLTPHTFTRTRTWPHHTRAGPHHAHMHRRGLPERLSQQEGVCRARLRKEPRPSPAPLDAGFGCRLRGHIMKQGNLLPGVRVLFNVPESGTGAWQRGLRPVLRAPAGS